MVKGSFNTHWYLNSLGQEDTKTHLKAKLRLKEICERNFCTVQLEKPTRPHFLEGWKEPKQYWIDVFAKHNVYDNMEFAIEVQGQSHSKPIRKGKDKDKKAFCISEGYIWKEFLDYELIGKKSIIMSDSEIEDRIFKSKEE